MSTDRSTTDIIEHAEPSLTGLADRVARRDATTLLLAPGTPSPTPGESELRSEATATLTELQVAGRRELREAAATLHHNAEVLAAVEAEEDITIPDRVPRPAVRPYEYGLVAVLAVAETIALANPIGTVLDLPDGSVERYLITGGMALIAAALAHFSGEAAARRRRATTPATQDAAGRWAVIWALAVVTIGLAAIVARAYTANLDATIAGGEPLDAAGLATFVLFQATFVAGSLGASANFHHRITDAEDARTRGYLADLATENHQLEEQLANADEHAAEQRQQVLDAVSASFARYRTGLAEAHPSVEGQVAWTARSARELADGSLLALLFPGVFARHETDPHTTANAGTTADPGPAPDPDADPDPDPDPDPGPGPGRANGRRATTNLGPGPNPNPGPRRGPNPGPNPNPTPGPRPGPRNSNNNSNGTGTGPARTGPNPGDSPGPSTDTTTDPGPGTEPPSGQAGPHGDPSDEDLFDAILNPRRG
jgi:hypothetical protein